MVGARRFERVGSRKDHRNGTYLRRPTSLGQIEVAMPRSRDNGSPADVIGLPAQEPRARRDDGRGVCERRVTAQDGRRHRGADGRACWALAVSRVAKRLQAVEGLRRADRGASPLSVPGRHVLGRPLGPQSRERECARGVCSGP